jgi:hypothetical protein
MQGLALTIIAGSLLAAWMQPAAAIPRTFVSGTGSGTTCTRAAPCASFATAQTATDVGGEIDCIDAGVFPAAFITKSLTIDCSGTLGAVASGFQVNAASVTVRIRGLSIRSNNNFGSGIEFIDGAALYVENCNFTSDTGSIGIFFFPHSGTARLYVTDSVFNNNSSTGITIQPMAPAGVRATFDGVRVENNGQDGIAVLNSAGTGTVIVQIRNSVMAGNSDSGLRISTAPGAAVISVTFDNSSSLLNQSFGVLATGASSFALVGRSTVMSNTNGIGGTVLSYQNNHITGNVTDGTPSSLLGLK